MLKFLNSFTCSTDFHHFIVVMTRGENCLSVVGMHCNNVNPPEINTEHLRAEDIRRNSIPMCMLVVWCWTATHHYPNHGLPNYPSLYVSNRQKWIESERDKMLKHQNSRRAYLFSHSSTIDPWNFIVNKCDWWQAQNLSCRSTDDRDVCIIHDNYNCWWAKRWFK